MCMGGQWGTVSDDLFSTQDSKVVCRQLGYVDGCMSCHLIWLYKTWWFSLLSGATILLDGLTYNFHYYGTGTGAIFLDEVNCNGNEDNLFSCAYVMPSGSDYHSEDVGVKCFETTSESYGANSKSYKEIHVLIHNIFSYSLSQLYPW